MGTALRTPGARHSNLQHGYMIIRAIRVIRGKKLTTDNTDGTDWGKTSIDHRGHEATGMIHGVCGCFSNP
ncbi:MAG: hypothetical protein M0036_06640 [Desulfobacteraceae bacterium]|nr:hypothetical protein [Desulfobacteraceae bacterium]